MPLMAMNWTFLISLSDAMIHIQFSTRLGGVSQGSYGHNSQGLNLATHVGDDPTHVSRNREIVRDLLGLPPVVYMNQVHGNEVAFISKTNLNEVFTADALVTKEHGIALAVLSADCVPMILQDPQMGVIAAAHVGRPGLLNGIVEKTVLAMQSVGALTIRAVLGPAICGDCYEVPLQMQSEVSAVAPASRSVTDLGTPGLDIRDGVAWQLEQFGIDTVIDPICTKRSELHYSYRRDGITGRTAGFVYLS